MAKDELLTKDCDFSPDFLLCYAAAGSLFQLFVMDKNNILHEITEQIDLDDLQNRISVAYKMINIGRIFLSEVKKIDCQISKNIKKDHSNYENLYNVWKLIKEEKPKGCVECTSANYTNGSRASFKLIYKKHSAIKPSELKNLVLAIRQVLLALEFLHDKGYAHCDIR